MKIFILGTFLILGWTFFELSGGTDFEPEIRQAAKEEPVETEDIAIATVEPDPIEEPQQDFSSVIEPVQVTRAENVVLLDLTTSELTQPNQEIIEEVAVRDPAAPAVEAVLASILEDAPIVEETNVPDLDIRTVAGSRVNMRSGPGTNYAVLDTLDGGTQTEVLEVDASGWARIRLMESGTIGWMAERLLSDS